VLLGHKGSYAWYVYSPPAYNLDPELRGATVYYPDGKVENYDYHGEGFKPIDSVEDYELTGTDTWASTFADTYQQTTFDRLVGWSRWLLINETAPPAWSPCSFKYQLPEDDMSGVPII
jgi:hypothetical protein